MEGIDAVRLKSVDVPRGCTSRIDVEFKLMVPMECLGSVRERTAAAIPSTIQLDI